MNFSNYFVRLNGMRGRVGGLPAWATWILLILALPGLAMLALSIVAAIVSIAALLILTVPAYSLLSRLGGRAGGYGQNTTAEASDPFGWARGDVAQPGGSGRKQVSVKIVE